MTVQSRFYIEKYYNSVRRHGTLGYSPNGQLVKEYTEIESGKVNDRLQLEDALHHCEMTGATLVVSKLDRLSRDLEFIAALMKSDNLKFVVRNSQRQIALP